MKRTLPHFLLMQLLFFLLVLFQDFCEPHSRQLLRRVLQSNILCQESGNEQIWRGLFPAGQAVFHLYTHKPINFRSNSIKIEQSKQNFEYRKSPGNGVFPGFFSIIKL